MQRVIGITVGGPVTLRDMWQVRMRGFRYWDGRQFDVREYRAYHP